MAFETFKEALKNTDSPQHVALAGHVKKLVEVSRKEICKNFQAWDMNDEIFRSRRPLDREDVDAKLKDRPAKLIAGLTYSQVMTYVAFSVMSVTQNARFFELEPTGKEDNPLAEPLELILERDLRRNQWNAFLIQFFLDMGRFSLGAAEVCYKEEYRYMRLSETKKVEGPFGTEQEVQTDEFQPIPTFIGNKVYTVSPYAFLPDLRLPLTRYQDGEFCGSEDVFSLSTLHGMRDYTFNLDKIPKYSVEQYKERRKTSRTDLGLIDKDKNPSLLGFGTSEAKDSSTMVKSGPVAVTKMVFDLIPKNLEVGGEGEQEKLGEEDFHVRYIAWLANDKTIIRFEEATHLHGMFPYICAQYLPDQHKTVNEGLADVCEQLTSLVTWKLNAHITSQRASLDSKFIVDPAGIDTKDLDSRSPYIILKKGVSQTGVDRYIKQFTTVDTTANVMTDVSDINALLEKITGFSAQMQGQYSTGRRSATQDRVVAQGAGARGKSGLGATWDTAFEPLGKQLIANNRQEMERETFDRILGTQANDELWTQFKADAVTIATSEDFFVFDGTLPSEKAFLAQSLQEILMEILANPVVAQVMGFDAESIRALFNQVYLLRGVTPARLPSTSAPAPAGGAPAIQALPPPTAATSGVV